MPIVYVLVNEAFPDYVKIGKTTDLEQRLRSLDNTSVPLPFRCVYAVEVDNEAEAERLLHQTFDDHRTRPTREFFEVNPQRVISAMKLTRGRDVTPKADVVDSEDDSKALKRATRRVRKVFKLSDAGLKKGDQLYFTNNSEISATVVDDRKVDFEGALTSLSASALSVLHRDGYTWQSVNGWNYWMFDGETISERLDRRLEDEIV